MEKLRHIADLEDFLSEQTTYSSDFKALVMNQESSKIAIEFADETEIQYPQNNARFGSLFPHLKRQINSELGSQKFFGFYAIEGNSSLTDM